jgi:phasin
MSDVEGAMPTPRPKFKSPPAAISTTPKTDLPTFEMSKMEIPAAFRELAERSITQAKETYEKMKAAAEEATDVLEDTYTTAARGASDYGLKVIEAARANANSTFDFASRLMTVKSFSEAVEVSTVHGRKQYEAVTAQSKELASLAQKTAAATAEPMKESFGRIFKVA